jgi:hypothetical protein
VVLRRLEGADIAFQDEVGTLRALDRFLDLAVCGVDEIANLAADGLLPVGESGDVGVDAQITGVRQRGSSPCVFTSAATRVRSDLPARATAC